MQFGKHVGKGIWALADKALPAVYGVGFILIIVRSLPESEFGAFGIIQLFFTFSTSIVYSFALQGLTKFAAENDRPASYFATSLLITTGLLFIISILIIVGKNAISDLVDLDGETNIRNLLLYLPILFFTSFYRNVAISLLQAQFLIRQIFWIDATYFLGVLGLAVMAQWFGWLTMAYQVIWITIAAQACSTGVAIVLTPKKIFREIKFERDTASRMWHFGKYSFWGTTMHVLYSQADGIFVSSYAGIVVFAGYNAAKIFMRIFDTVAQVIQLFLVPLASRANAQRNETGIRVVMEKTICFSVLLTMPVFLAMLIFPEQILAGLYNGKYVEFAGIVRVFAFFSIVSPWNAVYSSFLIGTGRLRQVFIFGPLLVILAIGLYILLTPAMGAKGTAVGMLVAFFLTTLGVSLYFSPIIRISPIAVILRTSDAWNFLKQKVASFSTH